MKTVSKELIDLLVKSIDGKSNIVWNFSQSYDIMASIEKRIRLKQIIGNVNAMKENKYFHFASPHSFKYPFYVNLIFKKKNGILADTIAKSPPLPSFSLPEINLNPKSDSKEKDIAPSIPKDPPEETVIYRYGRMKPGKFVPSEGCCNQCRSIFFNNCY